MVPCTTEDGATAPPAKRVDSAKGRKGAGRLEADAGAPGAQPSRDGLASAPSGMSTTSQAAGKRGGLHSAPPKNAPKGQAMAVANEAISDFIIEGVNGTAPHPAEIDAYLTDVIGPRVVKDLRCAGGAEWASRVKGLEALQQLVRRRASDAAAATPPVATGGQGPDGEDSEQVAERSALFRACVTVLARVLQDKVVPVFLPALSLLAELYSPPFLGPIACGPLPKAAIAHFAHQLVFRSGSSNTRAREEAASAILSLARCDAVGAAVLAPWTLRPLSNSKSAHAAVGRLELLRAMVAEFGLGDGAGATGLKLADVLAFALPLCESASDKSRDAAVGLVIDVRSTDPRRADDLVEQLRPSVQAALRTRLAPPSPKAMSGALSVSGRRLPPLAPLGSSGMLPGAMPTADDGAADEELIACHGTPPEASGRMKARKTAAELGARAAPAPRKKPSKRSAAADGKMPHEWDDDDDDDGLLAQAQKAVDGPRATGAPLDRAPTAADHTRLAPCPASRHVSRFHPMHATGHHACVRCSAAAAHAWT